MPDEKRIYFNGIDGTTGKYLVEPMDVADLVSLILGEEKDQGILGWLKEVWRKATTPFLGLPLDVNPADVTQAGWGVVFAEDEDPAVKAALEPLIEHRRQQIKNDEIVKVLEYKKGEGWADWLGRHQVAPGSINPKRIPYYLLLVGSPAAIPFDFGHLLDVEYGVGRLHFDTPEEYSAYAQSVIEYETAVSVPNRKEAVFFGPRHPFDQATKMSADHLVNPLADGYPGDGNTGPEPGVAARFGYQVRKVWGDQAKKEALMEIVCPETAGGSPPAFLFTASHGMGFPKGHATQQAEQGAILCQDWPGFGSISAKHYLAAGEVPADAQVHGMVIFHFACFGGGTPERDQFIHKPNQPPPAIANAPFVAALPKAWLSHPKGGALACIGHVERAWGYSILPPLAGPQIQTFENAIGRILIGQPLGYALNDFNERYAALSTALSAKLQKAGWGGVLDQDDLASSWIERNDAEGYVLLGDPAVSLRSQDLVSQDLAV